MSEFKVVSATQYQKIDDIFEEEQKYVKNKIENTTELVSELKNLPDIKEILVKLENTTAQQNDNFKELSLAINKLANIKSKPTRDMSQSESSVKIIKPKKSFTTYISGLFTRKKKEKTEL